MSQALFLATGLIAAGPVSVPPPPLPPDWLEQFKAWFEQDAAAQAATLAQAKPSAEMPLMEFSSTATAPKASLMPVSGAQLFSQRQEALRAGKLYTRLSPGSFQEKWGKATQQPTHQQWQQLLAAEARAIAKGQGQNRLSILVGDSLSQWFPSELLSVDKFWLNQGISGENSTQIRQRLQAFQNTRPDTVYLMAGINDLKQGASDATILNNMREMLRQLRNQHPNAEIVVQSILPTRLPSISNARIRNLNRQIVLIAQQEGASYLNLHAFFVDYEGKLHQELTTDGIHLNAQGYAMWQYALQEAENWVARR
ncbi:MAG: SGNH/GDSL hydrolase family protein [Jaaginema sp. PMC 1079.18]|nr:SGNH/GDSL hydrolase family protein [Jaaginema sp. PMC 1080.18]MEC4851166.1 SGNH/GDSL hydrolase family protein [Jaaginema sp. PMC 1079.18]MEC4867051.1 SGNH/GDSL hydrolase family protein [Jaaginema sp. PMC 1078.18]